MTAPLLFINARLIDPASGRDETGWLLCRDGAIADLGAGAPPDVTDAEVRDLNGLCLAPGLVDLRVSAGEPGSEHKETLATANAAAVAGGVTTIVVTPETNPVIDEPALIDFLLRRARDTADVRVYPAAALTRGLKGAAMSEIGLLLEAGAVMLSNGPSAVADARVLQRALDYARGFGALTAVRAEEPTLAAGGVVHEGEFAARLGLTGVPVLAERLAVDRDCALALATGARLLLDQLSSADGLSALGEWKTRGAPVFASVSAAHLVLNELDVGEYRTYARLSPPLRAEADRRALVEALKSGLIDVVVSAHDPQPTEDKRRPFAEATPGGIGLETLLSTLLGLVAQDDFTLIEALRPATSAPADLLGLPQGRLAKGAPADLAVFDPAAPWLCDAEQLRSKSKNSPFDQRRMTGRAILTAVGGKVVFDRAAETGR
ncbi:MAG: dihydroorotase [Maricaulaceae bacterium]|jgi:dihydroorotase